jgi:hypothetical protein
MRVIHAAGIVAAAAILTCPTASADTVGTLAGYNQPQDTVGDQLQGHACNASPDLSPNTCTPILYNNTVAGQSSIDDGAAALNAWLGTQTQTQSVAPTDHITVFCYSMGCMSAYTWISQHINDANAPSPDQVSFIAIGNPATNDNGVDQIDVTGTQYSVTSIQRQYELWTDFPNNMASPYYLLAVANALVGATSLHDYTQVDPNDPSMVTWTDGRIEYRLLPTDYVPLSFGDPAIDNQLRPLIEDAYNRPVPVPDPTPDTTVTTAVVTAPVIVSDPVITTLLPVKPVKKPKPQPKAATHKATTHTSAAKADRKTERQTAKAERKAGKKDR